MGGRRAWPMTTPTGSCWGLFGGALSWAPSATIDGGTSERPVTSRRDQGSGDEVVVIDLAGVERGASSGPPLRPRSL